MMGYSVEPGTVIVRTRRIPRGYVIRTGNVYRPLRFLCQDDSRFSAAYKFILLEGTHE